MQATNIRKKAFSDLNFTGSPKISLKYNLLYFLEVLNLNDFKILTRLSKI